MGAATTVQVGARAEAAEPVAAAALRWLEGGAPAEHLGTTSDQYVDVDTGVIQTRIAKQDSSLVTSIARGAKLVAKNGHLVLLQQDAIVEAEERAVRQRKLLSTVERVTVEQSGPIQAVVRVEGRHVWRSVRPRLPFTIRFYFYAGAVSVRLVHTLVFDGDPERDFVAGLGIRFAVAMRNQPHDRHVRLAGTDGGMLTEAVRGLTGLRRDRGASVRAAPSAKQVCISTAAYRRFLYILTADERVGDLMHALIDADKTFLTLDPIRKIRTEPYEPDPNALSIGTGTDFSTLAAPG